MKVILKRGPKGDKDWGEETPQQARQRARALGELHYITPKEEGDVIVVDAVEYYTMYTKGRGMKKFIGRANDRLQDAIALLEEGY